MINTPPGWTVLQNERLIKEEVLEIGDGYRAKNVEMGRVGLPFARAGNIDGGFDFSEADLLSQDSLSKVGDKVSRPGDVVFTSKGTVGRFAYVREDTPQFVYSPQLCYWRVLDRSVIYPRFLFYWMQGPSFMDQVHQVKGLTDMADYVSLTNQRKMVIAAPAIEEQRRIARTLAVYDDLIHNNTRRIAILEEVAEAIYREWFVNFRFPGHDEVEMIESELGAIPEGWEAKKVGDVIELVYGKGLRKKDRRSGRFPVYGSSGIIDYHDSPLVEGPGIIVGRKGNVGSVFWSDSGFCPIDTVFYVATELPLRYVYYNLGGQNFLNSDAAVPGLNRNQAYSLPFLVPPEKLLKRFDDIARLNFAAVRNLRSRNQILQEMRDLLLPRLVTGGIDVSALEPDPEAVVA